MNSELDYAIHQLAKEFNSIRWRTIWGDWESYYAEDRLYLIRNSKDGRLFIVYGKSPEDALNSLPKEKIGMMIRLDDVREPWLVKLGKDYSKAVAREADTKFIYETAVKHRKEIEEAISRIGGHINQVADEKKRGEVK